MSWTGGCLCGAIRYEADVADTENWYCHCRMCQKAAGSVVATSAIVPKARLRITQGEPKFYRSSRFVERGFCSNCGSPLFFRPVNEDWLSIQSGTLDDPGLAPPPGPLWCRELDQLAEDRGQPEKRTHSGGRIRLKSLPLLAAQPA